MAYKDTAEQVLPSASVKAWTRLSGSMVILSPGMYTVDMRWRATASAASPGRMPSPGAAMWIPTRIVPSSSVCTEKASSISVVVTSSMEKACTSANGSFAGAGIVSDGNPSPFGKCSNRKRDRCSSLAETIPPAASIRRCGAICSTAQAASSALNSMLFLSGLKSNCSASGFIAAGKRRAVNSSTKAACTNACWRFFSTPARAALSEASGAAL